MAKASFSKVFKSIENETQGLTGWRINVFKNGATFWMQRVTGMGLFIKNENNKLLFHLYHHTTSWEFDGCGGRTDIHDIFPIVFAIFLKQKLDISCAVHYLDSGGFGADGEISSSFIFPKQLDYKYLTINEETHDLYKGLIFELFFFEMFFWQACGCPCEECKKLLKVPFEYQEGYCPFWIKKVKEAIGSTGDTFNTVLRYLPTWNYFNDYKRNISLVLSPELCSLIRIFSESDNGEQSLKGIGNELIQTKHTSTTIGFRKKKKNAQILAKIEAIKNDSILDIQIENILCSVGNEYFVTNYSIGSQDTFLKEKSKVIERHKEESKFLFKDISFTWSEKVDPDLFEKLIKELLEREPGVVWIRRVANVYERDGGRDLICEWQKIDSPNNEDPMNVYKSLKVIVQCKAYKNGVSKVDVPDVIDTIVHHNYDGYFIATHSHLKSSLTDFLDRLKTSKKYFIDWWTRDEIEKRLLLHEDITIKYKKIVSRSPS